jgi:hypothetical protein
MSTEVASGSPSTYGWPSLRTASALYAVGFLIHNADHARRTVAASPDPVVWAGTVVAMLTSVLLTLVVIRHRQAALFAFAGGAAITIGVSLSHLLPKWGVLSDPLPGGQVDMYTWFAVLAEIVTAAVLAVSGSRSLQSSRLVAE